MRWARDSLASSYDWTWRWDDQRIKGATANRGRQYTKDRDFELNWYRRFFDHALRLQYHQELVQDIAQNECNENDKDRLQQRLQPARPNATGPTRSRTALVFAYRQIQDCPSAAAESANNNVKDSLRDRPELHLDRGAAGCPWTRTTGSTSSTRTTTSAIWKR